MFTNKKKYALVGGMLLRRHVFESILSSTFSLLAIVDLLVQAHIQKDDQNRQIWPEKLTNFVFDLFRSSTFLAVPHFGAALLSRLYLTLLIHGKIKNYFTPILKSERFILHKFNRQSNKTTK